MNILIGLLPLLGITYITCQDDGPVKETTYGSIQGAVQISSKGESYEEYLGIPFASPPLGPLRWEKPLAAQPWEGVRDATQYALPCVQYNMYNDSSEDCLYLNVFVPGEDRTGDNLPVMFWIHGGAFMWGETEQYNGYDLAIHGDVIVVVTSYRLSTLGWMSTEDEVAPGNYGLWDVQLSLEWVRDNIAAFGGDPNSITVFGQSAGAVLTSQLMISPHTNTLFKRGVCMSGHSSGFVGIALPGSPSESTEILARTVGCRRLNGSTELVECLRNKTAEELDFWGLVGVAISRRQLPNWMPSIDGDFIPQHPLDSWREGAAASLDYLTGVTFHDAASFVLLSDGSPNGTFNFASSMETMNASFTLVTNHYPGDTGEMVSAIYQEYPDMVDDDLDTRTKATTAATTDWWFSTWAHYEASQHMRTSEGGSTYMYNFHYDQSFLQYQFDWIDGSHSDDVWAVFGEHYREDFMDEVLGKSFNDDDRLVHQHYATYLVNFARNGDPSVGLPVPVEWPAFNNITREYMEISTAPQVLRETEEMREKYQFWNKEFPSIAFPDSLRSHQYRDVVSMSGDEFEAEIEWAVNLMMDDMVERLQGQPDLLEQTLEAVDNALEERNMRKLLEDY